MTDALPAPPKVVWKPLPGSQTLAVTCPAHHILFEGTRGPGKTDAQLMFFRRYVGQGYGAFWRGIIFDRQYSSLDDLVAKSKRWFPQFQDGAKFHLSSKDYKWSWPTGEELLFRALEKESDYGKYHGHEYPFIGWNELTKYPDSKPYEAMMSCNRSSFVPELHSPEPDKPLPPLPLVVFSTTNPYGSGHNWVKKRFIDVADPGELVRVETEIFNPRTQKKEKITKTQVRLFGSYKENTYLSPEYVAELENIRDPNKRKAWLEGDWNIVAGGALDDVWREDVHCIEEFPIPANWRVDRSFDWGSSKPFAVVWWAEANGEEIEVAPGKKVAFPKGTLFAISEWYGANTAPGAINEGVKMSAANVAIGILNYEKALKSSLVKTDIRPGPADNAISNVVESESESIATKMQSKGVTWNESDKSPGSRTNGLQLLRDCLEASLNFKTQGAEAGPGIYFFKRRCKNIISTLPVLPRDEKNPDDVDTEAEDHLYDAVRYRVLALKRRDVKFTNNFKF